MLAAAEVRRPLNAAQMLRRFSMTGAGWVAVGASYPAALLVVLASMAVFAADAVLSRCVRCGGKRSDVFVYVAWYQSVASTR